jgi:protein-disulfide isomerase
VKDACELPGARTSARAQHVQLEPPVGEGDHARGPADAPVTLVEYGDYECPDCGMAYPIVKAARRRLGDRLRFVFRNFPLGELHPHARHAAEAAEAVAALGGNDAFWRMHDALFEQQYALDDASLVRLAARAGVDGERVAAALRDGTYTARVRADFRSGVRSGANGTPTFFVNGLRWDRGWRDEGAFARALREVADEAEVRVRR